MAGFRFDQVDQAIPSNDDNKISFLKIKDDGWYAKVRFMYNAGEEIEGQTVHNVSQDPTRPKYVKCLRELGQPLETCPLCAAGHKVVGQYYLPVYVISIVSNLRGVEQEEPVNQVMLFQRGTTFQGAIQSIIRQATMQNKPIVSCVFNLVRNGKANDQKTNYSVELVGVDNTTLADLPPAVQAVGSYLLPNLTAQEMTEKYLTAPALQTPVTNGVQTPQVQVAPAVTPRTINANTFQGNTVVTGNNSQVPLQAPPIGNTTPSGVANQTGVVPF